MNWLLLLPFGRETGAAGDALGKLVGAFHAPRGTAVQLHSTQQVRAGKDQRSAARFSKHPGALQISDQQISSVSVQQVLGLLGCMAGDGGR